MNQINEKVVNSYHSTCRHPGVPCGDKYHRGNGHGYCYYCSLCNSSGGCFITTATLLSIGKMDNCDELNIFRNFRDNWLSKQPDGNELISEYYRIAPHIVATIDSFSEKERIYNELWTQSIEPCLDLIKQNRFSEANEVYQDIVAELKEKYLKK